MVDSEIVDADDGVGAGGEGGEHRDGGEGLRGEVWWVGEWGESGWQAWVQGRGAAGVMCGTAGGEGRTWRRGTGASGGGVCEVRGGVLEWEWLGASERGSGMHKACSLLPPSLLPSTPRLPIPTSSSLPFHSYFH